MCGVSSGARFNPADEQHLETGVQRFPCQGKVHFKVNRGPSQVAV